MPPNPTGYFASARAPRYSILFALPLLVAYEVLAWSMGQGDVAAVRNGADVLLKNMFGLVGGEHGLTIFTAVVFGTGAILVLRDVRRHGLPRAGVFVGMTAESVVYALMLGLVAGALTQFILTGHLWMAQGGAVPALSVPVQLMVSLGAGIYEELLFRVLLVAGLDTLAIRVFGWKPLGAGIFAAGLGALIFSAFHYVGPYGDPWQLGSFTFRAVAGLLFSGLYLLRGFGITAWSHALYDVFLTLGR